MQELAHHAAPCPASYAQVKIQAKPLALTPKVHGDVIKLTLPPGIR